MGPDDHRRRGVRVVVTDDLGRPVRAGGLDRWLASVAPARTRGVVTVAFVSDARIRALNRRYRGVDHATDVLSFPTVSAHPDAQPPRVGAHLGDIVIARGIARRQARAAGHRERDEHRVLALHGLLHLLGYDHENHHDAQEMEGLETRILAQFGYADPYESNA